MEYKYYQGGLLKYKAILERENCSQTAYAIALANHVDEYDLIQDVHTLEEAATEDLRISVDQITLERLLPYVDLRGYGMEVLERFDAKLTSYGWLDREPGQAMEQDGAKDFSGRNGDGITAPYLERVAISAQIG